MMYYKAIVQCESTNGIRPQDALTLAGGRLWFTHCAVLQRGKKSRQQTLVTAKNIPDDVRIALTSPRAAIAGLTLDKPRIMGVLNVTPDSFSDGEKYHKSSRAHKRGQQMLKQGADIIDIGGESTRPNATLVNSEEEMRRVLPVIFALQATHPSAIISIDTRKAVVAKAALNNGAVIFNDVSALNFDVQSLDIVKDMHPYICLMHAQGDPQTMQNNPYYEDVLLDVYDYLMARVRVCIEVGIPQDRIIIDPGIGFGKTLTHNLALLRGLSLFHSLGCCILLGVSRKRFIGDISGEHRVTFRAPGSIAVALEALRHGVQIIRCHDIIEHKQAFDVWSVINR